MRSLILRAIFGTATIAATVAAAQTHKVAKTEQVVRAVGVYEWTGDFAKPSASRLIPVSLFIEGKLEDAGVYIARPIPFALLPGNLYILQAAGVDKGTLDLAYAKHLQAIEATGDLAYDDGWFGYGSVKPLAAPRNTTHALKPSKTLPVIATAGDPNRPHLVTKDAGDAKSSTDNSQSEPSTSTISQPTTTPTASTASSDDSDRPTMKRRDNSGSTTSTPSTPTSSTAPADDPDRPTMTRHDSSGTTTSSGDSSTKTASGTQSGSTPADDDDRPTMKRRSSDTNGGGTTAEAGSPAPSDDPDRPTLKRHSTEDAKKAGASANDTGSVSGVGTSLNDDPGRPNLHRGKPTSAMTETDLPKLTGIPPNLHQMVAVSDAVNRDPHPFTLDWDDEAQHKAIVEKMEGMARAQLASYGLAPAKTAPTAAKQVPATPAQARRATKQTPPPQQILLDEDLKAYMLSYGGAATYVYSAHTDGTGAALRYVTIVAQADGLGDIKPAIQSVTDAAHLDRTPKMQFVDAVDADGSNRASLLFELRSQNVRQFALYRVIASHPEQIFLTGTTQ
jgi:hypothetical protein